MSDNNNRLEKKHPIAIRQETVPVAHVPAPTTSRDSTSAFFYMGLFSVLPTVAFITYYGVLPLAALLVIPRAIYTACHLSSRRYAAYEDTPPAQAAFVQSCLVWLGLACSWPAAIAFDVADTIIWQLLSGGFIAVVGPGVANQWFDLPRQIYVPIQAGPPVPQQQRPHVISGAELNDYDEVYAEQQSYLDGKGDDYLNDKSWLYDEDDDLETI